MYLSARLERLHEKLWVCAAAFFFSPGPRAPAEAKQERKFMMQNNKAAVIMGSDSDLPVVEKAIQTLGDFGVPFEAHVMSAHRTPAEACAFAASARDKGFGVIIAAAGKAAHLAGVLAGHTTLPVIGIPMKSSTLDGLDALLATVQMPSGVPVATVALNGAKNAAVLAAQILSLSEPALADKLSAAKEEMKAQIAQKDAKLQTALAQ